jgi:hypothetical protein
MKTRIISKHYALDVRLENLVRAFVGGLGKNVKEPSKTIALRDGQEVNELSPVMIGNYHALSTEVELDSDIRSAVALQGVRAQLILDLLMAMRMGEDEDEQSVVVVDYHSTKMRSPAVTHLGAVYFACNAVLKVKCIRDAALATESKLTKKKA